MPGLLRAFAMELGPRGKVRGYGHGRGGEGVGMGVAEGKRQGQVRVSLLRTYSNDLDPSSHPSFPHAPDDQAAVRHGVFLLRPGADAGADQC